MSNRIHAKPAYIRIKKSNNLKLIIGVLTIISIGLFFILSFSAKILMVETQPFKTTWALVLDGQSRDMYRSDFALIMLKENLIDSIAISGARNFKSKYNSEYYLDEMQSSYDIEIPAIQLQHDAYNTLEEAYSLMSFFKERTLDTVMLITSNYHSERAEMIFNRVFNGKPFFKSVNINNSDFSSFVWEKNRSMRKIWLVSWLKYIHSYFESDSLVVPSAQIVPWVFKKEQPILIPLDTIPTLNLDSLALGSEDLLLSAISSSLLSSSSSKE
jgi:uncharacterized SAM-binding protein YcdF (DUF218 family)